MRRKAAEFGELGARVVVVVPGSREKLAELERELPLPGEWLLLRDEEREAFRAYGLGNTTLGRFFTPRVLLAALGALARGHRLKRGRKNLLALGGDFVVGADGRLVLAHPSRGPADHPPWEALRAALGGKTESR